MRWISVFALVMVACKTRVEAPTEMEDLTRYVYRNYDADAELQAGVENLLVWIEDNLDTEQARRGYRLSPLSDQDTVAVEHAGEDHGALLGAAVLGLSPFDIDLHAETMLLDDQVWQNPANFAFYDRVVESADLDGFLAGMGRIDTINDIQTQSFGIRIPYQLHKDYRWVEADFGRAIVARTSLPEAGCTEGGGNCLVQSFGTDIWIALGSRPDTIRFTATWNDVDSPAQSFIDESTQINALAAGMVNVFEKTDEFLAEGGLD